MTKLCDRNLCTGCSACVSACSRHAITMVVDSEGFLYPSVDSELCTDCGLCAKSCPQLEPVSRNAPPAVYAAWNTDDAIRCSSSSGGMFYTFAQHVINHNGVVFGAVLSKDGRKVYHTYAETIEGVRPMMGSKYVQSDLGGSFRQVLDFLKSGRTVLFTGTPCQIAGLYAYIGKRSSSGLYTMDVVCHGVPSASFLNCYLDDKAVQRQIKDAGHIAFRNSETWPDCFTGVMRRYVSLYLSGLFMRESCYRCSHTTIQRVSDITVGDFWGIGEKTEFKGDFSKGCSLVLVNSEKGSMLLDSVKENLFIEERQIEEALERNTQLHRPTMRTPERDKSYNYMASHSFLRTRNHFKDNSFKRFLRKLFR